jgi:hypothetical protein
MTVKPALMLSAGVLLLSLAALAQTRLSGQPQTRQPQTTEPSGQSAPGRDGQDPAPHGQQPQAGPMVPVADVLLSFPPTTAQPVQAIAVAPTIDMIPITLYRSNMTSTNGVAGDFMHAMSGICSGSAFLRNDVKTIDATGFCDYDDTDGDQVFERFVIPPQPQDNPLQAAGHWTGGTGKYQHLQGGFVLTGILLPTIADGIIQVAGRKQGRYTLEDKDQTQAAPSGQASSAAVQSSSRADQAPSRTGQAW